MLSSITPLGERGRGNRWGVTVAWFVAGSTLGGSLLGLILGLVGSGLDRLVPDSGRLAACLAFAVAALTIDTSGRPSPLGSWRRQVDERWIDRYRPWVYGLGWGTQLGAGILTIVTSASTYLVMALAVLLGSWPGAVALATIFGLSRGLTILTARRLTSPEALRRFHQRMQGRLRLAAAAVVVADAAVALTAAAGLAG